MHDALLMAELLCTRLCHDLTGPIGAVNNGAEFLAEEGFNLQSQAVELITSSAFSAVARLQFYRFAYGRVRDQGEANLSDRQKMATDFFADSKITLDWPDNHTDAAGVSISQKMSRLLFNMLIISSGSLMRGGTISVRITTPDEYNKRLTVEAEGPSLKWDGDIEKILSDQIPLEELSPKNVQFFFTRQLAKEIEAEFVCDVADDKLVMHATRAQSHL